MAVFGEEKNQCYGNALLKIFEAVPPTVPLISNEEVAEVMVFLLARRAQETDNEVHRQCYMKTFHLLVCQHCDETSEEQPAIEPADPPGQTVSTQTQDLQLLDEEIQTDSICNETRETQTRVFRTVDTGIQVRITQSRRSCAGVQTDITPTFSSESQTDSISVDSHETQTSQNCLVDHPSDVAVQVEAAELDTESWYAAQNAPEISQEIALGWVRPLIHKVERNLERRNRRLMDPVLKKFREDSQKYDYFMAEYLKRKAEQDSGEAPPTKLLKPKMRFHGRTLKAGCPIEIPTIAEEPMPDPRVGIYPTEGDEECQLLERGQDDIEMEDESDPEEGEIVFDDQWLPSQE